MDALKRSIAAEKRRGQSDCGQRQGQAGRSAAAAAVQVPIEGGKAKQPKAAAGRSGGQGEIQAQVG